MRVVCIGLTLLLILVQGVKCHLVMEVVHNGKNVSRIDERAELTDNISERKAVLPHLLWPDKTVPYVVDVPITEPCEDTLNSLTCIQRKRFGSCKQRFDDCKKTCDQCDISPLGWKIRDAMEEIEEFTCLTFRAKTATDQDYVRFVDYPAGCRASHWGNKGGINEVNVDIYCEDHAIILHEIGHALGLYHEQRRPDRDDYVTINWHNIPHESKPQFWKLKESDTNTYGVPYDYLSVMHYESYGAYMEAKDPFYQYKMGHVRALSMYDIQILNKMYQCPTAYYRIRHIESNMFLDIYQGVSLQYRDDKYADYQSWSFDGKRIRNKKFPDKVLTMVKDTAGNGWTDVYMADPESGDKTQEWEHVPQGLYNEWEHYEYALGVKNGDAVGCYWPKDESDPSQQWAFEEIQ